MVRICIGGLEEFPIFVIKYTAADFTEEQQW